jgi:hypothetical protein
MCVYERSAENWALKKFEVFLFISTFTFCPQVTHVGISELASKNPSIETLIMSNCHNITDDGVINFVTHLSRLKHLDLQVHVTFIKCKIS